MCRDLRTRRSIRPARPGSFSQIVDERIRICPRCRRGNPADAELCGDCGTGLGRARVLEVPAQPDAEPAMKVDAQGAARAMVCPVCNVPLHAGEAFIHIPPLRWSGYALVAELAFRLRGRREKLRVAEYGENRLAARCPSCEGVWIGTHPAART